MSNMFDMIKQAASMKKQMKKIQKELARKKVESSSGGVKVVARGDMTIESVSIDPSEVDVANLSRLEKTVAAAANNALADAKKMAGEEMSKMTGGLGGLGDMLG